MAIGFFGFGGMLFLCALSVVQYVTFTGFGLLQLGFPSIFIICRSVVVNMLGTSLRVDTTKGMHKEC
ncbi:hypothetical protein QL285_065112 [Trifolium repens]|nr:hypothetical protein QL285_065110 [Trifolium repens]KAK2391677.1 hypothetical protein QL285_065112 [Trifolium repens]